MRILAFDTALQSCSAAFVDSEHRLIVKRSQAMERGHAEALMPMLADIVKEAGITFKQVERFAVTIGPGSFTGLRVGLAAGRGLALAAGRPLIGIGTLQALATSYVLRAGDLQHRFAVILDARRGEVYHQIFNERGQAMSAARMNTLADAAACMDGGAIRLVGTGAPLLGGHLATAGIVCEIDAGGLGDGPDPVVIARLGEVMAIPDAPPELLYLRAPDAKPQGAGIAHAAVDGEGGASTAATARLR